MFECNLRGHDTEMPYKMDFRHVTFDKGRICYVLSIF